MTILILHNPACLLKSTARFVAFAVLWCVAAFAADRDVTNQASLTFVDSGTGISVASSSLTVRARVRTNAAFTVTKSGPATPAIAGAEIPFHIIVKRTAAGTPGALNVTVNGQVQQLFMLRDAMRTGTTFVRFGRTSGGNPLYHRRGDPELTYTSVAPPESADIDGVALGISSLAAGGAAVLDFLVRINSDAKTAIENTAEMVCLDATSSEQNVFASNSVHVLLTAVATRVNFYNAGYAKTVSMGPGNGTLYFQANAPGMAKDPAAVETITVIVKSARTGDHETFTASETAPGSDIFRVEIPTQSGGTSTAANGDGMIQTASNDTITAQVLGGGSAAAKVLIDPAGIVFDSKSNKPVAGAQVTLIDATTGAPALVFEAGGGRQAANSVTTTEDGRFQFPAVNPGIYRLEVKPPPGYLAPSKVRANGLPADRMIHPTASFGENFVVDASTGAVMADYPVDFIATDAVGLFIRKSASRETAEMGDFVDYMIEVKNVSDGPLKDVVVAHTGPMPSACIIMM